MSVYELDIKGMRKTFMKFHQTLYGRTVFFLAYIIPFVLLALAMGSAVRGFLESCTIILGRSICLFAAFGISFIFANIYFYTEIRKFCDYTERQKKLIAHTEKPTETKK